MLFRSWGCYIGRRCWLIGFWHWLICRRRLIYNWSRLTCHRLEGNRLWFTGHWFIVHRWLELWRLLLKLLWRLIVHLLLWFRHNLLWLLKLLWRWLLRLLLLWLLKLLLWWFIKLLLLGLIKLLLRWIHKLLLLWLTLSLWLLLLLRWLKVRRGRLRLIEGLALLRL